MSVKIDNINRTCSISQNGVTHHCMLAEATITTGETDKRPLLVIKEAKSYITDAQLMSLINGGANDERGKADG
ncbi:DUF3203 family protein [Stutzerimonas zhaodongensis]|uniref:DUF3203 family protein n=1 Tax=Stutzerimonas TaxID=2901164 RepID=UPI00388F0759